VLRPAHFLNFGSGKHDMKRKGFFILGLLGLILAIFGGKLMADQNNYPVADKAEDVHPLQVGAMVPDGQLTQLNGQKVQLEKLINGKPTVLIFYRGGWCPYCNLQMGQLVQVEPKLLDLGYQMLAISPDQPAKLSESMDKHKINYTLLSDSELQLTRKFGLAYQVSPEILGKMKGFGVDLDGATGNHLHQLPVPAAYVVDKKGFIRFVYFNPDIKVRVKPDDLFKAAQEAVR
jgi:peroxiredoxin